jgi:hypothetical protein
VAAGAEVGDTLGALRWQLSGQRLRQPSVSFRVFIEGRDVVV